MYVCKKRGKGGMYIGYAKMLLIEIYFLCVWMYGLGWVEVGHGGSCWVVVGRGRSCWVGQLEEI